MLKTNEIINGFIGSIFLLFALLPQIIIAQGGHSLFVGGPWEIQVKMGSNADGPGLTFPIQVEDESKAQALAQELPILGTPLSLTLTNYLPDLKWVTSAAKQEEAGIVVQLALGGDNLDQSHWLTTDDPARGSISAKGVGRVSLKKLQSELILSELVSELNQGEILGVLSVADADGVAGHDFVIKPGAEIALEGSPYRISVLKYFPHYSMDTTTGEVANASDKPLNPALLVKVEGGQKSYEQWLWAKFPSFSHQNTEHPLAMEFVRFDLGQTEFNYILTVAKNAQPWLIFYDGTKVRARPVSENEKVPFVGNYYFKIKDIFEESVLVESWKNGKDVLLKPALVATVSIDGASQEIVLPLNKPARYRSEKGDVLFVFQPATEMPK